MPNRIVVTEAHMRALRVIRDRCRYRRLPNPVSNTSARFLSKLGWVEMRVTKVAPENRKIVLVRITPEGRNALDSAEIAGAL